MHARAELGKTAKTKAAVANDNFRKELPIGKVGVPRGGRAIRCKWLANRGARSGRSLVIRLSDNGQDHSFHSTAKTAKILNPRPNPRRRASDRRRVTKMAAGSPHGFAPKRIESASFPKAVANPQATGLLLSGLGRGRPSGRPFL